VVELNERHFNHLLTDLANKYASRSPR